MQKKQSFFRSITNAAKGILFGISGHRNMQIMLCIAFIVIIAGFYFGLNRFEWAIVWLCIGAVICLELFNTALETFIDHMHPQQHSEIGKVKDILAGAVLVACIVSGIAGIYIFITHWYY